MSSLQQANNFAIEFDLKTKLDATLQESKLRKVCQVRTGVVGNTTTFNRVGLMTTNQRTVGSGPLQAQDVAQSNVVATINVFDAVTLLDDTEMDRITYDLKSYLIQAARAAVINRIEQVIINAMNAGASATVSVGADGTNWTLANMIELANIFDRLNMPQQGRYFIVHPNSLKAALQTSAVTSSDFNTLMALMGSTGDLTGKSYLGFEFIVMGNLDTTEGGLPFNGTTNVRTNFAVSANHLGLAFNRDIRTKVSMIDREDSWQILASVSVGAVGIGSTAAGKEGIYKYLIDEAV
jgi:hypothetical protein